MTDRIREALTDAARLVEWLRDDEQALATVDAMADEIAASLRAGGRLVTCGNGGSMCDAMHMAEELSGRYRDDRPALDALALSDPGYLSCVANDYGYDRVFARGVEAHGRAGDVLTVFTTSGNSRNVLAALERAGEIGMRRFGMLGKGGGEALPRCDHAIVVPSDMTDRIQEIHIKVVHAVIEGVERRLHPGNYR